MSALHMNKCTAVTIGSVFLETPPTIDVQVSSDRSKQQQINLSIAKNLIIKCNLPPAIVEHSSFREFLKELYPKWYPISAKRIKNTEIQSLASDVRNKLEGILNHIDDISITVDLWADRRCRSFLGITAHFIDVEMKPQAFLVDFVRMKIRRTGENIRETTEAILERYGLKEKIFRIITDNASSMIKAYKFGLIVNDELDEDHSDNDQSNTDRNNNNEIEECE
jgi:hypothetical protein